MARSEAGDKDNPYSAFPSDDLMVADDGCAPISAHVSPFWESQTLHETGHGRVASPTLGTAEHTVLNEVQSAVSPIPSDTDQQFC